MAKNLTQEDIARGRLIRVARMRKGMTQAEAASELGVSVNTLIGWEKGKRPSVKHWHLICQYFQIPCEALDEELSAAARAETIQVSVLKQLELCKDCERKVAEAISQYYAEDESPQKEAEKEADKETK